MKYKLEQTTMGLWMGKCYVNATKKTIAVKTKCDAISCGRNATIMMLMCMCGREYSVISAGRDRKGERKIGNQDNSKAEGERGQEVAQRIRKRERTPDFHLTVKTANCLYHREAVKEKTIAGGNRFWGHPSRQRPLLHRQKRALT